MKKHSFFIIFISTSYLIISLSTTILNKYILSVLNFNTPYLLVVLQSLIICSILLICKICKISNLKFTNYGKWVMPSFFLSVMIFSGSKSLLYLDISFYTLLKNSSIILIAVSELLLYDKRFNTQEFLAYILMIVSSYYNLVFSNYYGLLWISLNILSTTVYVLTLRHVINIDKGSISESIFFPNLFSIFLIGILSFLFESVDFNEIPVFTFLCIGLSSVCALFTALSTAYVLNYLSSTTYTMLGGMNKILLGFTGFIFIGEKINKIKIMSLLIGVSSTVLYTTNNGKSRIF